jgi:membrane-bound ClpP family serine protease
MSTKNDSVDLKLHMTVKSLAVLRGKIICILNELVKKAELLREKEEEGEDANHLLEMMSDNLNELLELFEQKKDLRTRIEQLKSVEKEQMKR